MYKVTDQFIEEHGQDAYEEIFDALYKHLSGDEDIQSRVYFSSVHKKDVINSEADGVLTLDDEKEICFRIENGDWAGSRVLEYGEEIKEQKYYTTVMRMVLDESKFSEEELPYEKALFHRMKDKVEEMERNYNYDRYVTGHSEKIKQHYQEWMEKRNITIEYDTVEVDVF